MSHESGGSWMMKLRANIDGQTTFRKKVEALGHEEYLLQASLVKVTSNGNAQQRLLRSEGPISPLPFDGWPQMTLLYQTSNREV